MAVSHTTKKQRKKAAWQMATEQVAEEVVTAYLSWWTKQEIQRLISNGALVVYPAANGKGHYVCNSHVWKDGGWWRVQKNNSDTILTFFDRQAAIFYCLFDHKKMFQKSLDILQHDYTVRKLEQDQQIYKYKYKQAQETNNWFARDLWNARLSDVNPRLEQAEEQLRKLVNSAKYIKLWDTAP